MEMETKLTSLSKALENQIVASCVAEALFVPSLHYFNRSTHDLFTASQWVVR